MLSNSDYIQHYARVWVEWLGVHTRLVQIENWKNVSLQMAKIKQANIQVKKVTI